jgi:poly(3-hydroxybutyrate) depolymerase
MMAYALACYLNNEIAAVACISGCLGDTSAACTPVHPTATLNIHGTQDNVISYQSNSEIIGAQEATAFWADRNNTLTNPSVTTIQSNSYALEHIRYEAGDSNVVAEHYKVIGGDHRWFNFSVNGKNANLLLWEFFDQFDIYGSR